MNELKMTGEEIRNLISLREDYWEYDFDTNCYAFALGLDVPESDIVKDAYQPGVMGAHFKGLSVDEVIKMPIEERMLLDFDFLGIECCETSVDDITGCKFDGNGDEVDRLNVYWIISLFRDHRGNAFHFTRKSHNGVWWHKYGYFAPPIEVQYKDNDTLCSDLGEYRYVKTYRLSYTEKASLF